MVKSANKIIISGTVQGIFFKNFTKENANLLNLKGFVRSLDDGNTEVYVEGEKENITKIIEILNKGPAHSQIRNIKIEERKWSGDLKEFKILRI
jgi:acylphosphatase